MILSFYIVIKNNTFFKSKPKNVTCPKSISFNSIFSIIFLLFLLTNYCNLVNGQYKYVTDDKILDSCQRCKIVVDSFKEGLRRTARGKHEGGDAHWEENKLKNYANSEIRLTEIQENLCNEVKNGKDQCHNFAENYENELEEWFLKIRKNQKQEQDNEGSTLFEYLCNQIGKVCCPDSHFGAKCQPCHGYPDQICFNRGYCSGNGTRQGKGNCICHAEFDGEFCEKCSANYLAIGTIEILLNNKINVLPKECQRCDPSCASTCHSLGPKGCHVCKKGYFYDNDNGCLDIDECKTMELNPCKFNTYCINTQGSFKCYQCHESCQGCTNKGSNSCLECAPNYQMNEKTKECIKKDNEWPIPLKYIIYISFSVAIFFIALNHILLASCLSILATIFITIIEMPDIIFDYL